MNEFWVFGYGSLMWNPGFPHEARVAARVTGYRRALCVRSSVHRGTERAPGLVLGLDRGGACSGQAFRVAPQDWKATVSYLRERELVSMVYFERYVKATLANGRQVRALTYVVDRSHKQYSTPIAAADAARVVYGAVGKAGPNIVYVFNTVAHLREMGVRDHNLEAVESELLRLKDTMSVLQASRTVERSRPDSG